MEVFLFFAIIIHLVLLSASTKILFMFNDIETLDVVLYCKALVCLDKVI